MSQGDNLTRQLEILRRALEARNSGLPSRVNVLCYSADPEDRQRAIDQALQPYGVDQETAEAAMTEINVVQLPWLRGRSVGITSIADPRIPESLRLEIEASGMGKKKPYPVVGTMQDIEAQE